MRANPSVSSANFQGRGPASCYHRLCSAIGVSPQASGQPFENLKTLPCPVDPTDQGLCRALVASSTYAPPLSNRALHRRVSRKSVRQQGTSNIYACLISLSAVLPSRVVGGHVWLSCTIHACKLLVMNRSSLHMFRIMRSSTILPQGLLNSMSMRSVCNHCQ